MRRTLPALVIVVSALGLVGCSSSSEPAPTESASASSESGTTSGGATIDAPGLVAAMWNVLKDDSKTQMCGMYADQGDKAGQLFVAGAETDPKAELMTAADKEAIAAAGAAFLADNCPAGSSSAG